MLDLAIVVVVAAITEANVWRFNSIAGPKWLTVALPLLWAVPLAFRRSRPLLVAVLVLTGVLVQSLVSGDSAEGFELILATGVAAYSLAAYAERRGALLGGGQDQRGNAVFRRRRAPGIYESAVAGHWRHRRVQGRA